MNTRVYPEDRRYDFRDLYRSTPVVDDETLDAIVGVITDEDRAEDYQYLVHSIERDKQSKAWKDLRTANDMRDKAMEQIRVSIQREKHKIAHAEKLNHERTLNEEKQTEEKFVPQDDFSVEKLEKYMHVMNVQRNLLHTLVCIADGGNDDTYAIDNWYKVRHLSNCVKEFVSDEYVKELIQNGLYENQKVVSQIEEMHTEKTTQRTESTQPPNGGLFKAIDLVLSKIDKKLSRCDENIRAEKLERQYNEGERIRPRYPVSHATTAENYRRAQDILDNIKREQDEVDAKNKLEELKQDQEMHEEGSVKREIVIPTTDKKALIDKIRSFKDLENGWDGYSGVAPNERCIELAVSIVSKILPLGLPLQAFPIPYGGVQIEYSLNEHVEAEISIHEGDVYYAVYMRDKNGEAGTYIHSDRQYLKDGVGSVVSLIDKAREDANSYRRVEGQVGYKERKEEVCDLNSATNESIKKGMLSPHQSGIVRAIVDGLPSGIDARVSITSDRTVLIEYNLSERMKATIGVEKDTVIASYEIRSFGVRDRFVENKGNFTVPKLIEEANKDIDKFKEKTKITNVDRVKYPNGRMYSKEVFAKAVEDHKRLNPDGRKLVDTYKDAYFVEFHARSEETNNEEVEVTDTMKKAVDNYNEVSDRAHKDGVINKILSFGEQICLSPFGKNVSVVDTRTKEFAICVVNEIPIGTYIYANHTFSGGIRISYALLDDSGIETNIEVNGTHYVYSVRIIGINSQDAEFRKKAENVVSTLIMEAKSKFNRSQYKKDKEANKATYATDTDTEVGKSEMDLLVDRINSLDISREVKQFVLCLIKVLPDVSKEVKQTLSRSVHISYTLNELATISVEISSAGFGIVDATYSVQMLMNSTNDKSIKRQLEKEVEETLKLVAIYEGIPLSTTTNMNADSLPIAQDEVRTVEDLGAILVKNVNEWKQETAMLKQKPSLRDLQKHQKVIDFVQSLKEYKWCGLDGNEVVNIPSITKDLTVAILKEIPTHINPRVLVKLNGGLTISYSMSRYVGMMSYVASVDIDVCYYQAFWFVETDAGDAFEQEINGEVRKMVGTALKNMLGSKLGERTSYP